MNTEDCLRTIVSTFGFELDDDQPDTGGDLTPESLSGPTAVWAGATAIVIAIVSFVVLSLQFTSFPVFAASPVTYATNVTLEVWGCLFSASAIGVGVAASYWYIVRVGPVVREYMRPPALTFLGAFVTTFVIEAAIGVLRLLLLVAVLLLSPALVIAGPRVLRKSVAEGDVERILAILVLSIFLCIGASALYFQVLTFAQTATVYGGLVVVLFTMVFPTSVVQERLDELSEDIEAFSEEIERLDAEIRRLDHEWLARHGVELPYRGAAIDPDSVSEPPEDVYTPGFEETLSGSPLTPSLNTLEAMVAYYRELGNYEARLASTIEKTGGPTPVTERLGAILGERQSNVPSGARYEQTLVSAAIGILEAYETFVENGDEDAISELATRLDAVRPDENASDRRADAREPASYLEEIQVWADERARHADLESRGVELRERWPATAGTLFGLDIDEIDHRSNSSEIARWRRESGLEVAERIVTLATTVQRLQADHQMAVLDRLPDVFGRYLHAGDIDTTRVERLETAVAVAEAAAEATRQHPSYPFDRPVEHICAELETGTPDTEIDELLDLVEGATKVLDFLDTVDVDHPRVRPDEWRETVETGLETPSPENVRPLVTVVDRVDDTLTSEDSESDPFDT